MSDDIKHAGKLETAYTKAAKNRLIKDEFSISEYSRIEISDLIEHIEILNWILKENQNNIERYFTGGWYT